MSVTVRGLSYNLTGANLGDLINLSVDALNTEATNDVIFGIPQNKTFQVNQATKTGNDKVIIGTSTSGSQKIELKNTTLNSWLTINNSQYVARLQSNAQEIQISSNAGTSNGYVGFGNNGIVTQWLNNIGLSHSTQNVTGSYTLKYPAALPPATTSIYDQSVYTCDNSGNLKFNSKVRLSSTSDGNLRVGDTTNAPSVDVDGNSNTTDPVNVPRILVTNRGTTTADPNVLVYAATKNEAYTGTYSGYPYAIYTNNVQRMYIDGSQGNVSINTRLLLNNGTSSAPSLGFVVKPNTGLYMDTSSGLTLLAITQDGTKIAQCYASGIDFLDKQVFFNTLPGPTYYPQLCWDQNGARDTGIYSRQDGILKFMNNGQNSLHVSDNILSHQGIHNSATYHIGSDYPSLHSNIQTQTAYMTLVNIGSTSFNFNASVKIMYYRTGNVLNGRSLFVIKIPSGVTTDGLEVTVDQLYQKVQQFPDITNIGANGLQVITDVLYGTMTIADTEYSRDNRVAVGRMSFNPGNKLFFRTMFNSAAVVGRYYNVFLDFSYVINVAT
jgi:hypothetical protein